MKKSICKTLALIAAILSSFLFFSCSKVIGYSVVLWGIPEHQIQDCELVPVYLRSNINHVYVIGTPSGEKLEVPLWKITEPTKKSKANKLVAEYKAYEHQYADAKIDGLPCRAEPDNVAKQVYRLRKGETIRILKIGQGMVVTNGKETLEGSWFKVLTHNGTQGWCFSHNLNMYAMDATGNTIGDKLVLDDEEEFSNEAFDAILNKPWYPDSFNKMLDGENVDLTILNASYNFKIDTDKSKVTLSFPPNKEKDQKAIWASWSYDGYVKSSTNQFNLNGIPATIIIKRDDYIVVRYTDNSGKPQELNFITIDEDQLSEAISKEKNARYAQFKKVINNGPYESANYGTLKVKSDYTFTWENFDALVGSIIGSYAKTTGSISTRYSVDKKYAGQYDGVLAFKFDGQKDEVLFLYKNEANGLRLEDASGAKLEEGIITSKGLSPLVLFFRSAE